MVTSLTMLAGATLAWPVRSPARRLRLLTESAKPRRIPGFLTRPPAPWVLIAIGAVFALLLCGIGVAIAVAVGGTTAVLLVRSNRRLAAEVAAADAMVDAMHGMVAELRSGAHPVAAAESAAREAKEPAAAVLTAIAATARLGGDLTATLDDVATRRPRLAPVLRPLVHAWSLAHRHGLPLADVLDAVRRDIADRVRFAHRVRARMAGPRASGAVLAVLPLLGVALGQTMGADPVHVLLFGGLGQLLLAVGTALICAGLWWITQLTSKAVL